ncbi:NUDIX hydrolase [Candidatus Berkelbacteria bacterium]|nr:NUDIX hydrolase [Candidatus Berkelbacteria bacterium]
MGKIPDHAKRVFNGVIFDIYQWEQTLYDGSTTIFEKAKRPDSVVVLAVNGNKILVARDEQPTASPVTTLPGGETERGDTPEAAARRELLEETGYHAATWELFGSESIDSTKIDWTIHYFIARNLKKVAAPDPGPGEMITPHWVPFEEFVDLTRQPDFRNIYFSLLFHRSSPEEIETFRQRLFAA